MGTKVSDVFFPINSNLKYFWRGGGARVSDFFTKNPNRK